MKIYLSKHIVLTFYISFAGTMSARRGDSGPLELKGRARTPNRFIYLFICVAFIFVNALLPYILHIGCSACYIIGGGL